MSVEAADFRAVLGRWATGVAVVTTRTDAGVAHGLTVNSFASVSLDPPLVLFSLGRDARSFQAFMETGRFAVNVLRADQSDVSTLFAGAEDDRFSSADTVVWKTGAPVLADCLAAIDCTVSARHDGGDHVIIVGAVQALAVVGDGEPLGYWQGDYRAVKPLA